MFQRIEQFFVIVLAILFYSCSLITFETFYIQSNISDYDCVLTDEYVVLEFSTAPEKHIIEEYISLKMDNTSLQIDFIWDNRILKLKPHTNWQKGKRYILNINNSIRMKDGRTYRVSFDARFYYGSNNSFLVLESYGPNKNVAVVKNDSLVFYFNKAVHINSFYDNFSISPSNSTDIIFSENNTVVTVTPKNAWNNNQLYTWKLSDLQAEDGYCIKHGYESTFYGTKTLVMPEVISVCPVDISNDVFIYREEQTLDSYVIDDNPFSVIFSKSMNIVSVLSAITIEPSIKGYWMRDSNREDCVVFVPQEPYGIDTRYCINISASAKDSEGLALFEEKKIYFTSANYFLTVNSISFDDTTILSDFSDGNVIYTHMPIDSGGKLSVMIKILFSSAIENGGKNDVLKNIRIVPLFPSSAAAPYMISAHWDAMTDKILIMEWENFTAHVSSTDLEYYYTLTLGSGKNGVANGRGGYLMEDICVVLQLR